MSNSSSKDSNSSPSALSLQSPPPSMSSPVVFSPPLTSSKPSPTPPNNGTINPPPQRASPLPPPPLLSSSSGLPEANFTLVAPLATSQSNLTSHGVGSNQQMKNSHAYSESGSPAKESSKTVNTSRATPNEGEMFRVTLGGVVIIALIAFIFSILKKRKTEDNILVEPIKTKQSSFSVKSGVSATEHYIQPLPMSTTIHSGSYRAQPTSPMTATGYGSYRGYGSHSGKTESSPMVNSKVWFTYKDLMDMTDGFSPQSIIGEGGFGCVYKGLLPDGREVAVKQLNLGSGQGEGECRAEVEIISRVRHRHLVSLVGYCIADQDRLLVYEFVPNSTLEHHLHGKGMPVMEWSKRVKIAIGAAKGLAYLHEDCRIIHRDVKSANILLDSAFEAKVADFGLPKLSNDVHTHISTRVMGTFGYLAPEYASSGNLTDRSDVFSFGVVLLELITGLRPVDASLPSGDGSLVDWARPLLVCALDTGDVGELLDPRLGNFYEENEVFRMIEIAAACVRHSAPKRPHMVQVVRALHSEGDAFDLCNGVKFVQSTNYGSRKSSADLQRFRQMGFDGDDYGSDYGNGREYERRSSSHSVEYHYRDSPNRSGNSRRGCDYRTNSGASVEFDEMKGAKYNWEYGRESPYRQTTPVTGHGYMSDSSSRGQYQPKNYPYGEEYHTRNSPLGPMNPRMVLSLSQNPSTLMREPRSGSRGNYRTHGDVYVNYASNHYYKKGINML